MTLPRDPTWLTLTLTLALALALTPTTRCQHTGGPDQRTACTVPPIVPTVSSTSYSTANNQPPMLPGRFTHPPCLLLPSGAGVEHGAGVSVRGRMKHCRQYPTYLPTYLPTIQNEMEMACWGLVKIRTPLRVYIQTIIELEYRACQEMDSNYIL
jgi:hypothetical protein